MWIIVWLTEVITLLAISSKYSPFLHSLLHARKPIPPILQGAQHRATPARLQLPAAHASTCAGDALSRSYVLQDLRFQGVRVSEGLGV